MENMAKVMAYCAAHGSITVRDAFELDINSPTKVISNMKTIPARFVCSEESFRP